jgi:hypothetical protein
MDERIIIISNLAGNFLTAGKLQPWAQQPAFAVAGT